MTLGFLEPFSSLTEALWSDLVGGNGCVVNWMRQMERLTSVENKPRPIPFLLDSGNSQLAVSLA